MKSATGDLSRMRRDRALAGDDLAIFSGDDDMTVQMMRDAEIRACGVISVMSNIAPRAIADLVRAVEANDASKIESLSRALLPLTSCVTVIAPSERVLPDGRRVEVEDKFRNPVPCKTMMAGLGMLGPTARAPLGRMTAVAVGRCRAALSEVWARNPEILAPIEAAFEVSVEKRLADDALWSSLTR